VHIELLRSVPVIQIVVISHLHTKAATLRAHTHTGF